MRESFNLDADPPIVTIDATISKHRRRDVLPLLPATAKLIRQHLALRLPGVPAFKVPNSTYTSRMLQHDLRDAGIPYCVNGRFADFHSLRHTFISNLAIGGVHPAVAQALARHSTIVLTMNRYSHILPSSQVEALQKLPSLRRAAQ